MQFSAQITSASAFIAVIDQRIDQLKNIYQKCLRAEKRYLFFCPLTLQLGNALPLTLELYSFTQFFNWTHYDFRTHCASWGFGPIKPRLKLLIITVFGKSRKLQVEKISLNLLQSVEFEEIYFLWRQENFQNFEQKT